MTARLTILASGSSGNVALIELDGQRWLIDLGLEPKELDARLAEVGASWSELRGVLMTHRHSDHWKPKSLGRCWSTRLAVHCHRDHLPPFRLGCPEFRDLERERLVRPFVGERPITLTDSWQCRPIRVRHDGGATFGFRFDRLAETPDSQRRLPWSEESRSQPAANGPPLSFVYMADVGCWDNGLVERLRNLDLLALEFNHDEPLLRQSSRPAWLIHRIAGDEGHLSNEQAAGLLRQIVKHSAAGRLKQVVQLHLSQECNSPELATASARAVLDELECTANVHCTEQARPSQSFVIG